MDKNDSNKDQNLYSPLWDEGLRRILELRDRFPESSAGDCFNKISKLMEEYFDIIYQSITNDGQFLTIDQLEEVLTHLNREERLVNFDYLQSKLHDCNEKRLLAKKKNRISGKRSKTQDKP